VLGLEVLVADVLEVEMAVEAGEVAGETEKHFGERRMNVEVVLSEDVVGSELAGRSEGERRGEGGRARKEGSVRTLRIGWKAE
jgi:hypothetical protein